MDGATLTNGPIPDVFRRLWELLPGSISDMLLRLRAFVATPVGAIVVGLLAWISLVRSLRYRRYNAIHREYGPKWDNGRGTLTPEDAQKVVHLSLYYDMPLLLNYAVAFALFKTYAISTISGLLMATKQLGSGANVSRRYADTDILISTWCTCPISGFTDPEFARKNKEKGADAQPAEDPRAMIALARVNWLHSQFKISNEDFVYTLSLFVTEPDTWASKYGWRKLSPLERNAYFIFWREIGLRMNIQDIPDTLEGLHEYVREYEEGHMFPAQSNHDIAIFTLQELLAAAPDALGIKKFGERISICLMPDNVREAMMYPKQARFFHAVTRGSLAAVSFVQSWLMLPRRKPKHMVDTSIKTKTFTPGTCPRMHPNKWTAKPWYKPESSGFGKYMDMLLVSIGWHTEMPGPHLKSSGYRLEEIGPAKFETSGHEQVLEKAAELQGCPLAGPWSAEGRQQNA